MSGLIGGRTPQAQQSPAIGALQLSGRSYGSAVPWLRGTNRITGSLVWYDDFSATAHTSSSGAGGGKGGGGATATSISYTYSASIISAICEGPVSSIGTVWATKAQTDLSSMGGTLLPGSPGTGVWGYLSAQHPAQAIPYSGIAAVGFAPLDLGDSASMPNLSFEATCGSIGGGNQDADAASVITDIMRLAGYTGSITGADATSAHCADIGIFISPALSEQRSASDVISDIMKTIDSDIVISGDVIKLVPYSNNNIVYTITDDDIIVSGDDDPVVISRSDQADIFNRIQVEYLDRDHQYNTAIATADDQAAIDRDGLRAAPVISAHHITSAEMAQAIADRILSRSVGVRRTYAFQLSWRHCLIESMDCLRLISGWIDDIIRVVSVDEDDSGILSIEAEECPDLSPAPVSAQRISGWSHDFSSPPDNTNAPALIEAPMELTGGALQLWVYASGGKNWGGCDIWIADDGITYRRMASVISPARTGRLAAPISQSDTVAYIDFSESRSSVVGGTASDAALGNTLLWVGGEIISYAGAELIGPYMYRLSGLQRGWYGTATAHSAGDQVARMDGSHVAIDVGADHIGIPASMKLPSVNLYGASPQALDVPAYSYTVLGAEPPPTPSGLQLSGGDIIIMMPYIPADMAGYQVRILSGGAQASWDLMADWPAAGAITASPAIPLAGLGAGAITIAAKSVDTRGNPSVAAAYATAYIPPHIPQNITMAADQAALGWPGALSGGSRVGGVVVADYQASDLFAPEISAPFAPYLADKFAQTHYNPLQYTFSITPPADCVSGTLSVAAAVSGSYIIEYRDYRGPLWAPDLHQAFCANPAGDFAACSADWAIWPGSIMISSAPVDIRITILGGVVRGGISAATATIDVPDIVESFYGLAIPAAGARLPITKKYHNIYSIGSVVVRDTGSGAISIVVVDYDPVCGPMVRAINASGVAVAATIDIDNMRGC